MKSLFILLFSISMTVNFYPMSNKLSEAARSNQNSRTSNKNKNKNSTSSSSQSQTGNGNDAIDSTLEFARDIIKEEEPMKIGDKGEVKPCKYCNITGVHTIFRSGDVTCIEENEFKIVDFSLGVKKVNASCFKCATLLISGNADGQLTGMKMRAKIALHPFEESKNQVREVKVTAKGNFRFRFKGGNILSRLLGIVVNLLSGIIAPIIQQEIQKSLPKLLRENKEQMNMLFMGC